MLEGPSPLVCNSFGSKVSLSDGVARWDESLMFLCVPSSSTLVVSSGFCRMFPGFSYLFLYPRFSLFSFVFLVGFLLHSVGGCHSLPSFLHSFKALMYTLCEDSLVPWLRYSFSDISLSVCLFMCMYMMLVALSMRLRVGAGIV